MSNGNGENLFSRMQETTPAIQASTNPFNGRLHSYGATADYSYPNQQAPPYNPATFPADFSNIQQVQPAAQDVYMHGTVQDRNY